MDGVYDWKFISNRNKRLNVVVVVVVVVVVNKTLFKLERSDCQLFERKRHNKSHSIYT